MIDFDFAPDAARARQLNNRMHGELAKSLRYVVDQAAEPLRLDPLAINPVVALM
ncbi:MAG: HEXXH motif domain-containing protein, partial [Alphaproteobacteria bacterium]